MASACCVSVALLSSHYKYSLLTDHIPVDFQIDNLDFFLMMHFFVLVTLNSVARNHHAIMLSVGGGNKV